MKAILLVPFLCLFGCSINGQNDQQLPAKTAFTFNIEKLEPPAGLLREATAAAIYKDLFLRDAGYSDNQPAPSNYATDNKIVAQYKASPSLVNYGYHSFFDGMYHAYAEHRPFTLSPDMIWLLIMQGFSQHVNNNPEHLRKLFVKHEGKLTLLVRNDKIRLDDPGSPWEDVFPEFSRQIDQYTGGQGLQNFTADFSTTTTISRMASQVTLMDAMKKYFEYVVMRVGCGIPAVTLEGTPNDWNKILQRTKALEKYELAWWTRQLEPILAEFVRASEKKVRKDFWQNMFKYHETGGAYKSKTIDGWIVKFFPYNKDGKRNNLDSLSGSYNLPDEICKVNILYQTLQADGSVTSTPLELWAGFTGLQQNKSDFMLKPEIGWMVKKADSVNNAAVQQLAAKDRIDIRVNEVPREILALKKINALSIIFTGDIKIPEEMKKVQIVHMSLRGTITEATAKEITAMFPRTRLYINGKNYAKKEGNSIEDLSTGW